MLSDDVRRHFRWRTSQGTFLSLDQMETRHVFHAMKMCFNHLSNAGVPISPVLFTKRWAIGTQATGPYSPHWLAWHVVFFILEIDRRGDLFPQFAAAYTLIRQQVIALAGGRVPELPEVPEHLIGGRE